MLTLPATLGLAEAPLWVDRLQEELRNQNAESVVVDAAALTRFDSSALAVLLQVRREAARARRPFILRGASSKLLALAELYGVREMLGVAS